MNRRYIFPILLSGTLMVSACSKKSEPASSTENTQTAQSTEAPTPQPPPSAEPTTPPPPAPEQEAPKKAVKREKPISKPSQTAQAMPVQPPAPPPPIVIPSGTVLTVRLEKALSSKSSKQGDRFDASLAQPLVVQGKTVAPTGAAASGTVTAAKDSGRFKGEAGLDLSLDTLVVQGTRYQIQTAPVSQTAKGKGKRTAAMIGGGTGAGALIGGLAGGGKGAAIGAAVGAGAGTAGAGMTGNSNDINLPVETALSFHLSAPVTIKPPQPQSSTQARE